MQNYDTETFNQSTGSPQLSAILLSHLAKTNQPLYQGMQAYQTKITHSPMLSAYSPQVKASPSMNLSPLVGQKLGFGVELDSFWNQLNGSEGFPSLFTHSPQPDMSPQINYESGEPVAMPDYASFFAEPVFDDSEFDQLIMDMQNTSSNQTIFKHALPTLLSPPSSSHLSYVSPNTDSDFAFMQYLPATYNQSYSPSQQKLNHQPSHPYSLTKLTNLLQNPPHTHAHQESLQCTVKSCQKRFTQSRTLALHLLSHSDSRPHACQTCSSRFKRLPDLQRHVRSMHTVGDGCFVCPEGCGKSFPRSDALKRHLVVKGKGSKFGCEMIPRFD